MKSLAILALLLVGTLSYSIRDQLLRDLYEQWKLSHSKLYGSLYEDEFRFNVFTQNYLDIQDFNDQDDSVTLALNQFADLTSEEFASLYTGTFPSRGEGEIFTFEVGDLPTSVDWRTKGAVTPVKNQGTCGSCWAFSATGALEGLYFINNSNLVSFSEQNFVDCVTDDMGCNGGWPIDAMLYASKNGVETEGDYPYTGVAGKCAFNNTKALTVNSGYYNVTPQDIDQLKAAVAAQPVSVGVQASQFVWQFYDKGVIKALCGDQIDHGVLIVGYDVIKSTEAWIVKNSWGATWGNAGYVYISTNPRPNQGYGVCGIYAMPAIPYKA